MVNQNEEQLIEVGRYMMTVDPAFDPFHNHARKRYTFQLLIETLRKYDLEKYLSYFLETLLFDCIIGNTDRHQENWAFVGSSSGFYGSGYKRQVGFFKKRSQSSLMRVPLNIIRHISMRVEKEILSTGLQNKSIQRFAPIYDSGSSLGRELAESRVAFLLDSEEALDQYVMKGSSELHWKGTKLSHFDLITNLKHSDYANSLQESSKFLQKWDDEKMSEIVQGIDDDLPPEWREYCVPDSRKVLICKLLTLRAQKLKELLHA